jgi:hypothetical protein
MQHQRDDSEYEQQVDQPTGYVIHGEASNPGDQQDHEQHAPDTHSILLMFRNLYNAAAPARVAQAGWPQSQAISVSSLPASSQSWLQYF